MKRFNKRLALALAAVMLVLPLSACGAKSSSSAASSEAASAASSEASAAADTSALAFDNTKWNYDATNNVYWQVGVAYCAAPQDAETETLGIYVPGSYLNGTKNADGTYTCTVNASGAAGSYTAATAPVVLPVNTPGYAASPAPTEYSYDSVSSYIQAGYIYLQPGIRGRQNMMGGMGGAASADSSSSSSASGGAPWGVTDIKAAIRYYRYNAAVLPGSSASVFTFGMSGGGAQSALVGATGDSALYTPYLEAIGAAMTAADGSTLSDAVLGSMCWCPITDLDMADAAYEWNMGQFASAGARDASSFGSALSQDLASAYADYINALGLKNGDTALTLTESSDGIYQAGTYYDYILSVVETSLNNFLADTTFPYTPQATATYPGGSNGTFGGGMGGSRPTGPRPDAASGESGTDAVAGATVSESDSSASGTDAVAGATVADSASGDTAASGTDSAASASGTTYATAQDYIDSLNSDTQWITYDAATNTAAVSSVQAFVEHCKNATKSLGAFDEVDRGQGENSLFGDGSTQSLHFDAVLGQLLSDNADAYAAFSDWDSAYVSDYAADLAATDSLGTSMQTRVDMYNPLYFLSSYYKGAGSSTVASYWRIRTGIDQPDTALSTEVNLALALEGTAGVRSVDFATVWGMAHTMAERTGDSTSNFIAWVDSCMAQ